MQLPRRLLRFLIQQPLILFNDFPPKIGLSHLPAHHSLKIGIVLFGLPQIHHIVYGLCGKVVFDPLLSVLFPLVLGLLMAGLKLSVALEEVGQSAANFTGDLGQVIASLFQVLVDGNAPLYAFIGPLAKCKGRDWVNFLLLAQFSPFLNNTYSRCNNLICASRRNNSRNRSPNIRSTAIIASKCN